MAEAVVGIIVDKLVGGIAEELSTAVINELKFLRAVRGEMQSIADELNMMKAFLRYAEENPDADPRARTGVKQVQELAYDAEDCVDEFMLHLNQPTARGLAGALQRCMRRLRSLKARHRIANKIKDIKSGVEHAKEMRLNYHLNETTQGVGPNSYAATIPAQLDPRLAALFVEEAELVGMGKPKEKLIQWLTAGNEPHLSVISVVGMGGLGKTTLVRKVYESPMLGQPFQFRAWVTVSKFQIEDLLRDMIVELQNIPRQETEDLRRPEQLIEKLKDHLKDKRYLIVFDDIWTMAAWESIKLVLPDSGNGSRVVITTRIETVATACRSAFRGGHVYKPQPLSHEQSWDLFSKRVFKSQKDCCPPDLMDLSDAILKRCGGLPLAIVAIAGLLASKPNKTSEVWRRVHDRLPFELETNPDLEKVKQIVLNLSYNDLPYDLKHCFLYLSKYPEDYEIKRRHVVELWVAEGLARGTHGISAEEVAEGYFDEFINRSVIQPSKVSCDGKVKSCRVHDVMLEVMVSKSREQNSVSLLHEHGTASLISEQKIRRLSAHTMSHLESTNLSHVRSITMFGVGKASFASPQLRLLRILDLEGDVRLGGQQLEWIGKLVHLRYMNIKVQGFAAPEWGNLHELETLNCRGMLDPRRVTGLQKLRHLRASSLFLTSGGIANLKALQTLETVHYGEDESQLMKELGELTQLRHLGLYIKTPDNMLHLSTSLAKLNSCLRYLTLYVRSRQDVQVRLLACLESISPPPLQLQKLALYGPLKKFPSWVASLKDVAKITLRDTELEDDAIKVLQNLPHLIHLKLKNRSYVGEHLCFGREGFPSLRILLLEEPGSMKSMRFEEGAMPNVRRLAIYGIRFPPVMDWKVEFYGNEPLPGLKELDLHGVSQDVADILLQFAETHPNHPRVTLEQWTVREI